MEYLFLIYSCKKNLQKSRKLFNINSDILLNYKIKSFIVYGDTTIDKEYELIDDKYLVLNVEDDYAFLYSKTLRLFKAIINLYPSINGCFKCDDDIILNVESILEFIDHLTYLNIEYSGLTVVMNKKPDSSKCEHRNINIETEIENPSSVFCGGPLYYLSNKSLRVIKETKEENIKKIFYEDKMIGYILNQRGIFPIQTTLYSDDILNLNERYSYHNYDHKNTLYLRIHGGLGNQMFQIASGYGIAKKNNMNFIVLNSSHIKENFTHIQDNNTLIKSIFNKFPNININFIKNISTTIYNELNQDCFLYKKLVFDTDIVLNGYFQNEKYFIEYKDEIIQLFKSNEIYRNVQTRMTTIERHLLQNSYFIHVRRGDYLDNKLYQIDYDSYYRKAIKKILEFDKDPLFLIFSNDIEYCKTYDVFNDIKKKFVDKANCLESMYLMSFCKKGGICSNSTFSWWASYLNTHPYKIVTFPSIWLNNEWKNDIYYKESFIISV